jgi:hypothetical protein
MDVKGIIAGKESAFRSAIEHFSLEAAKLRTGRANASIVEDLLVDCYGSKMPLKQMASITVPEPRLIVIQPWDQGMVASVADAIRVSDLGLNPADDGHVVRLALPQPTEERRKGTREGAQCAGGGDPCVDPDDTGGCLEGYPGVRKGRSCERRRQIPREKRIFRRQSIAGTSSSRLCGRKRKRKYLRYKSK